ncbi:MAG TPA: hypothetical protein VLN59_03345 [Burkholderiales bacterium]|nr:hypothetical protein [Burkholderiales bacterium]
MHPSDELVMAARLLKVDNAGAPLRELISRLTGAMVSSHLFSEIQVRTASVRRSRSSSLQLPRFPSVRHHMVTRDMRERLHERYGRKPADPTLVFKCAIGLFAIAVVSVIGTNTDALTQTAETVPASGASVGAPVPVAMTTSQQVDKPGSAALTARWRVRGWKSDAASDRRMPVHATRCASDRSSTDACLTP